MTGWRLFLDDEREPAQEGYVVVRSYDEFVRAVTERGIPSFVTFDHDLGDGPTGYDCAKWLVDRCLDEGRGITFELHVHSQNPVGRENIERYVASARAFCELQAGGTGR